MKTHLNLATRDLPASVDFYSTLLDAQPVKAFDTYALFVTEQPQLELALDRDDDAAHGAPGVHFGLAVDSDGRRWETYFVHEDVAQRGGSAAAGCCQNQCCEAA